jgi:MoaA/NifB/PqqE/SkfB family radical SAM enzyme
MQLFKGYHYSLKVYNENNQNGGFTQLSLDLSSKCNYGCDWCFNKKLLNQQDSDILSLNEKKKLLVEAVSLGAKTLVIPGAGEPTLDPQFYSLVEIANELGLITVVYSNLTGNLNLKQIKFLFENNVSIGIKLDSFKPYYFVKRYHVSKYVYKKFLLNLNRVLRVYRNSKKEEQGNTINRIIANMVLTNENKSELSEIVSFCKNNDLPLFLRPVKPVFWAKELFKDWKELGNTNGNLFPEKELIDLANKYNTLFSPSSTLENHCAIYSFGLTVKNNGDVQICPDHHDSRGQFGNVKNNSLKEIISNLNKKRIVKKGFCVMLQR